MSLETILDQLKAGLQKRIPEDVWNTMEQRTDELASSGIMDGVITAGMPLPSFALENSNGKLVGSSELLARGAVVLTVFRGHW